MLEPQAPDSLARWGLMNSVFETRVGGGVGEYLSEPIARRMMADNPGAAQAVRGEAGGGPALRGGLGGRGCSGGFSNRSTSPAMTGRYPIVRVWEKSW